MQPRSRGRADTGTPPRHGEPRSADGSARIAVGGGESDGAAPRRLERRTGEPDPMVEAYKRDVDRTLLRQNLRRSVTERVENLIALQELAAEARRAGRARGRDG